MDPQHTNAHTCKQTCIPRQSFVKAIRASEIPMISSSTELRHTHALTHTSLLWRGYPRTKKTTSVSTKPTVKHDCSKHFPCLLDCFAIGLTYCLLCMNRGYVESICSCIMEVESVLSSCVTLWYRNCGF